VSVPRIPGTRDDQRKGQETGSHCTAAAIPRASPGHRRGKPRAPRSKILHEAVACRHPCHTVDFFPRHLYRIEFLSFECRILEKCLIRYRHAGIVTAALFHGYLRYACMLRHPAVNALIKRVS
jgi:hypothetical protein